MLIKVCGLKEKAQILALDQMVDFIGFIFYRGSMRYATQFPSTVEAKRVGVFVNSTIDEVLFQVRQHSLDFVQLHGDESPEFCAELKQKTRVIKAFGIHSMFDFSILTDYIDHIDYFLFDTKTVNHGGSGKQFDWALLEQYNGPVPFLLSGGISPNSIEKIRTFKHPFFAGIDLNSGFENAPGNKNNQLIQTFLTDVTKL